MMSKKTAQQRRNAAHLAGLKRDALKCVRELGMSYAAAEREIRVAKGWIGRERKKDPAFDEAMRKARDGAEPAANWQEAFLRLLRMGSTRNEALDKVREKYPELSAVEVNRESQANEAFAKALDEIQARDLWEIEDNLLQRAKSKTPEARMVLSRMGDLKYGTAPKEEQPEVPDSALSWFTPEEESLTVEAVMAQPFSKKRLNDDKMVELGEPPRHG